MKLTKVQNPAAAAVTSRGAGPANTIDRRTFLRRAGMSAGGAAALGMLPATMMRKAHATTEAAAPEGGKTETVRSICTHCSA